MELLASKDRADDTDFHVYEIPISEILRGFGGRDYREIESVIDKAMSRVLTIRDPKGWTKYNVFSRCRYRREEGILELCFHPDLKPHYLNLQKHFAQYNLLEYLMLPSIYSQRIFEIIQSWSNEPEITISLTELHEMLNTPESLRANFKDSRRRVLEKAHKDITGLTSLRYEWEPVKKGRAVVAVRFIFSRWRYGILFTIYEIMTCAKTILIKSTYSSFIGTSWIQDISYVFHGNRQNIGNVQKEKIVCLKFNVSM